jgi:hypothetical protein
MQARRNSRSLLPVRRLELCASALWLCTVCVAIAVQLVLAFCGVRAGLSCQVYQIRSVFVAFVEGRVFCHSSIMVLKSSVGPHAT